MSQFDKILNDLYHINNPFYVKVQKDIENKLKAQKFTHVTRMASQLTEAVRRLNMFVLKERDNGDIYDMSNLLRKAARLDVPSRMKTIISSGLMTVKDEVPRVNNWYYLTLVGFNIINDYLFIDLLANNQIKVNVSEEKFNVIMTK